MELGSLADQLRFILEPRYRMRPRTRIEVPNPSESEFENFDKAIGMILTKKKQATAKPAVKSGANQDRKRLPRP